VRKAEDSRAGLHKNDLLSNDLVVN